MIRIVHTYPDLLNLYGGDADLRLLIAYLKAVGEEVSVEPLTVDAVSSADLIYFGAGTENKMLAAAQKLMPLRDALLAYYEAGKQLLFVGSSAALPMQSIIRLDGKETLGLGLIEGKARIHEKRNYTEVLADCPFGEHKVVGSYNSSLEIQTQEPAFLRIVFDSDKKAGAMEGVCKAGLVATQVAAPLLVRNPGLLDHYADTLAGRSLPDPNCDWYRRAWMGYVCAVDILKNAMHK